MRQTYKRKRKLKKRFKIDDHRKPEEILKTQGFWIANVPMFSHNPKHPKSKHGRYIIAYPILSEELKPIIHNKLLRITDRFQRIRYKPGMIYNEKRKDKDHIFIPSPNYFNLENTTPEN